MKIVRQFWREPVSLTAHSFVNREIESQEVFEFNGLHVNDILVPVKEVEKIFAKLKFNFAKRLRDEFKLERSPEAALEKIIKQLEIEIKYREGK